MKHILLEFAETPAQDNIDTSCVEYDHQLNLNVVKGTKIPAVNYAEESTQTMTKSIGEGSDCDKDIYHDVSLLTGTSTQTRMSNETSDNDPRKQHSALFDTSTLTLVNTEVSDSDKNFRDVSYLSDTRTLTESTEASDSDR